MRRNGYLGAPSQKSDLSNCSGDLDFHENNFSVGIRFEYFGNFFCAQLCMRRKSINYASSLKTAITIVFMISYKGDKFWRFYNAVSEFWVYFHCTCTAAATLELSVKNLNPPIIPATSISYKMYFHYRLTFTWYSWCFCTTTLRDLVTLIFDLLTLTMFHILFLTCWTYIPVWIILQLLVLKLWITEFDHIFVGCHSHCTCVGSRDPSSGAKCIHIFEIPDPNFSRHFATFRALRRTMLEVKIQPIVMAIEFTVHAQCHVTCT